MGITYLIFVSYSKATGDFITLERRLISDLVVFVMLKLSFEFHTFYGLSINNVLDVDAPGRKKVCCVLNFPLASTMLEFNFSARDVACWREKKVCLTHYVMRARFDTNSRREG